MSMDKNQIIISKYKNQLSLTAAAKAFHAALGDAVALDICQQYLDAVLGGEAEADLVDFVCVVKDMQKISAAYQAALAGLMADVVRIGGFFSKKDELAELASALTSVLMADLARHQSHSHKPAQSDVGQMGTAMKVMDNAVESSMAINNLFVECLKAEDIANDVDHRVNSISAAIEEMTATVATISQNTSEALDFSTQARQNALEGRRVSDQSLETMQIMKDAVQNTTLKTEELSSSSRQIEGIITKIQKIAEQTNLLALNATIEAARAGEAGKGFAVVASEVKGLANETSAATTEIADIIGALVNAIGEIVGSMDQVSLSVDTGSQVAVDLQQRLTQIEDQSNRVSDRMNDISHALKEQGQASSEIAQASVKILENSAVNKQMSASNADNSRLASQKIEALMANMAELTKGQRASVIKLAKSDHVVWKRKLSDMLAGKAALNPAELKDHTQCRLGGWYYSLDDQDIKSMPSFAALEAPHAVVHKCGIEAFELFKKGNHEGAFAKMDELEKASQQVVSILNDIDGRLTQI